MRTSRCIPLTLEEWMWGFPALIRKWIRPGYQRVSRIWQKNWSIQVNTNYWLQNSMRDFADLTGARVPRQLQFRLHCGG